jgi:hypothetical protein
MIGLTMLNAIYGLSDVLYTKWLLFAHLLELIISKSSTLKFKRVSMSLFLNSTPKIWGKLYLFVWKSLPLKESQQYRYFLTNMYWRTCLPAKYKIRITVKPVSAICSKQSWFQKT